MLKKILLILILLTPVFVFAQDLVPCKGVDCSFKHLEELGKNILNFLVIMAIPLSAIAFAWAGFLYITSGGSQDKVKKAHDIFKKVAIGLFLVLSAYLIVNMIFSVLTNKGDIESYLEGRQQEEEEGGE